MSGIFSRLFGAKKKEAPNSVNDLINMTLENLIEKAQFELSFEITEKQNERGENVVDIEFSGSDEDLLKENEGQLIDSFQLFLKRVIQHNFPEDRTQINIDCNGFQEDSNQALVDMAEKLKEVALEKGKSVYFRALPPKDRKIVHQYLSSDSRVKSRSVGEGLFKKIKIYPVKANQNQDDFNVE